MSRDETFLSRWSRRKRANAGDDPVEEHAPASRSPTPPPTPTPVPPQTAQVPSPAAGRSVDPGASVPGASVAAKAAVPASEAGEAGGASDGEARAGESGQGNAALPPLESLGPDSDFTGFMQAGVDPSTRASALRRLFADPHFNQMDGLDIYIDDYGKPDPIPLAMLKMMKQAHSLGLFDSPDDESPDDKSPDEERTDSQAPAGDALAPAEPVPNAQPGDEASDDSAEPRRPTRS